MYFMLGVLIATLVALLVLPAVWHRAVRLTTKRVEAAVPVSIFEVQADKDQQRAFYALNQRRLELQLDGLRETLVRQAADIEQKRRKIFDLEQAHADLGIRHAALTATGADRDVLLGEVQDQLADATGRLAALESEATSRAARLAGLETELADTARRLEETQQAHAEATARIESLEADVAARTAALAGLTTERNELSRVLHIARADLDANRSAVQAFSQRRAREFAAMEVAHADMERLRADHATALSALASGATDAEALKSALADFAARVTAEAAQAEGAASPVPALLADAAEHDLAARIKALLEGPEEDAAAAEAARLAPDAAPTIADDAEAGDTEPGDTEVGDTAPGDTAPGDTKVGHTEPDDTEMADLEDGLRQHIAAQ